MNVNTRFNRRQFLQSTARTASLVAVASATAPTIFAAESPGKRIGVGCIGLGGRGSDIISSAAPLPGVRVTAVCDVYEPHLPRGVERSQNPEVKTYVDYRELLADPRVDAVIIATPDHWHCPMVLDAAKARKDIYCEKGFSRTVEEAKRMSAAIKQAGIVFQLGHQARASNCALQAKELLDFVQYLLGHGFPDTCSCAGLNALLKDDREVPDTWIATYQSEKLDRTATFTGSIDTNAGQAVAIYGKDATLTFNDIAHNVSGFTIRREGYCQREMPEGYARGKTPGQPNHLMDFFNAVRSRGTPKCPVEEAFIESVTAIMSVESFKRQRVVRWDAARQEMV